MLACLSTLLPFTPQQIFQNRVLWEEMPLVVTEVRIPMTGTGANGLWNIAITYFCDQRLPIFPMQEIEGHTLRLDPRRHVKSHLQTALIYS